MTQNTLIGYSSNLVECYECGVLYCGHCGHNNCSGGRVVPSSTTSPNKVMNGKEYRDYLFHLGNIFHNQ